MTITTTACPAWCQLLAAEHKRLHGAPKASYEGVTAQTRAASVHRPGADELMVEITVARPVGERPGG